jgi:glycosyltransferase involved in cell wall biosynthesis
VPAIGAEGEPGPAEVGALVVPAGAPEQLAALIGELLDDQPRLVALGEAARARVLEQFTWKRCGEQTLAAYEEALR